LSDNEHAKRLLVRDRYDEKSGKRRHRAGAGGTSVAGFIQVDKSRKEARVTKTREIPKSQWQEFFSGFSDEHDAEPVDVQVVGSDVGAQIEGQELHLRGISRTGKEESSDLALLLESVDGRHLTHMIEKPVHVWLQKTPESTDKTLEIESADGTRTLVSLGA
jgi:hypothetical protein